MYSDLALEPDGSAEFGIRQVQDMAKIISRLIADGEYLPLHQSHNFQLNIALLS